MTTHSSVLRNRTLWILGFSESVSGVGNWISMMAVYALVVFRGEGSVAQSSAVFLAGLLPTLLASPVAGWLCDRFDRKWLMIGSELLSGLIIAGLIVTTRLEWILVILALQAVSISLMTPARQAVLPQLVACDQLTSANALLQQLAGIVKIGAPILAGAVLAVLNPHQAVVLDLLSFLLSALILSRLPSLPPQRQAELSARDSDTTPHQLWPALRQLPILRLLFLTAFLSVTVMVSVDVLAPVFIRDVLHQGESTFGLAIGLVGLGTLGASLWLMSRRQSRHPLRDISLGLVLLAGIPAILALIAHLNNPTLCILLAAAACLIGGVGNGLLSIQYGTLLQTQSPLALLGRFAGLLQSTQVSGQLLGTLLTSLLVPLVLPMGTFFALVTLALWLVALNATLMLRRATPAVYTEAQHE